MLHEIRVREHASGGLQGGSTPLAFSLNRGGNNLGKRFEKTGKTAGSGIPQSGAAEAGLYPFFLC
ncbi:hypothetical protein D3C81_2276780 [compost metagenome]